MPKAPKRKPAKKYVARRFSARRLERISAVSAFWQQSFRKGFAEIAKSSEAFWISYQR